MSVKDSTSLVLECPACEGDAVSFMYWFGAWKNDPSGIRVRVLLEPGEKKQIDCKCSKCGHTWSEYVVGG